MSKLKSHSVLIALMAAIIIIVVMSTSIYAKKEDGTFYIRDLQGSKEAIEDVVISGEIRDGYHRTNFRMESGLVKTNTDLFDQPMYGSPNQPLTWDAKLMNGVEYYVSNSGPLFEVVASKRVQSARIPGGTATVNPPVHYQKSGLIDSDSESNNDNSVTYTNPLEYGLANIKDKIFFTLPTTTDYTGSNGIYELKFSDNWGYRAITGDSGKEARTVAAISLDKNKAGSNSSIEILGLEAVGSRLALIIVEDNELVVRSYDSESGEQLGEAKLPEFFLAGRPGAGSPPNPSGDSHYENYEAFSDNDHNILNLSFNRSSSQPVAVGQMNKTMLSIDLSNGVSFIEAIKESFSDGDEDNYSGMSNMSYRNGKLYVVKTVRSKKEEASQFRYDIVLPKRFMIYVYQASKMIYKGELITDINEDNIRAMNLIPQLGGFGYDQSQYRSYNNLKIE